MWHSWQLPQKHLSEEVVMEGWAYKRMPLTLKTTVNVPSPTNSQHRCLLNMINMKLDLSSGFTMYELPNQTLNIEVARLKNLCDTFLEWL